jgi:3-methylcrotonyl-CoA carboxylase alpha subunit
MFDKILIANRGEIACRVARTARRMGVRTVAVYSDADADALHVEACDEAYRIGPPPPRESYLDGDAIIAIARSSGAQAIHPGYGFLSENEAFASACASAGIVFIGPPPSAIAAMGSKSAAKRIMGAARVPLVPGYHGDDQQVAVLAREAARIGFPVLIKATAGGGGKGMKIVERDADFTAALASAQREAKAAFGDDRVLLERYLTAPRHIEIQVFADTHGNVVHLFERDCSVQRRHQKVLEEAPAPGMTSERRVKMGDAAVAAAKAIGYVGAGTVEFIAEQDGTFYFMEMNTRLQVEHPVTEMITGLDLVEWQLRVAAGEALPLAQSDIALRGHAIEARIYAEDPERGFLPSIGKLVHLVSPRTSANVRVDTGVRAADTISPYYDPMIAKLVAYGEDRPAALRRLAEALSEYEIAGVATNVAFLSRVVTHDAFASGRIDTGLIDRHRAELFPPPAPAAEHVLVAAAIAQTLAIEREREREATTSGDPYSPWHAVDPWWINTDSHAITLHFGDGIEGAKIAVGRLADRYRIGVGGKHIDTDVRSRDGRLAIVMPTGEFTAAVVAIGEERHVFTRGEHRRLTLIDPLAHAGEEIVHGGHLAAPMSGTVVAVMVRPGDRVAKGAALIVLEAMKMEHTITSPSDGAVTAVNYAVGDRVTEGADLVDVDDGIAAPASDAPSPAGGIRPAGADAVSE